MTEILRLRWQLDELIDWQRADWLFRDLGPHQTAVSADPSLHLAPPEWDIAWLFRYEKNNAWGRVHTDLPGGSHWGHESNCQWGVLATQGTTRLRFWRPDQVRPLPDPPRPPGLSDPEFWSTNPHVSTFLALEPPEHEYTLDPGTVWLIWTSRPHQAWGDQQRRSYKLICRERAYAPWPQIVERFQPWIL